MLARLSDGFYLYCSNVRHDLLATNCVSAWIYQGKIPEAIGDWLKQGRPFNNYDIREEKELLIFKISHLPELTLKPAELHKILPIIFNELALKEPKRLLNEKQEAKLLLKRKKREELFAKSVLRNVALKVAYFGWDYDGLARQMNTDNTIEEIILQACEKCCLILTAKDVQITRCGRTDKGVSAFSQVISLYLRSKCEGETTDQEYDYPGMLNNVLPPHIRVLAWSYVGLEFDSRFQVLYRSYKYYFPGCDLDIGLMQSSLDRFIGTHNFRGFCKADRTFTDEPNFERTISFVKIDKIHAVSDNPSFSIYCITILGHAFLWHQIRNMVSVLLRIGMGIESPKIITDILKNKVKYSYGMASELPLVLFDCEFENIDWKYDEHVNLSKIWFESAIKSVMIKELFKEIPGSDSVKMKDIGVLCDTKTQGILSRPFIK